MMPDMMELRRQLEAHAKEALRLKRLVFDADYYQAHVHLSNAESETHMAVRALLADPPVADREATAQ